MFRDYVKISSKFTPKFFFHMQPLNKSFWSLNQNGVKAVYGKIFFGEILDEIWT